MIYNLPNNRKLKIVQDDFLESPRTAYDNLGVMYCKHKRYNLGDNHKTIEANSWQEVEKILKKDYAAVVIIPIYMFDHSGISLSTSKFNCPWDSGQVGFIYCSKAMAKIEFKKVTKKIKEIISKRLISEIEIYNQYLNGEVYGYELIEENKCSHCDNIKTEIIDSCYGFYGNDIKTNGILDNLTIEDKEYILSKV